MQILSITPNTRTYTTGRLSDGSDRQTITVTEYHVVVQDGGKYEATMQTDDTQAIADAYAAGLFTAVPISADERMEQLEAENTHLKTLIEEKDRENKNALFEIYSMLLGGG